MWHFRVMSRAEINEDPTAGDFFNVDALHNAADGLVREAIQNSLDAKVADSKGPVIVRISFHEAAEPTADALNFFKDLMKHVSASETVTTPPGQDEPLYWLAIEDFNTRGLVGDPLASDDPSAGIKNDFFYFWRNIGRGKKEGTERGRWGLGKTMFPATSRIHTFFGLTRRIDDGKVLLMGQSVLKIHRLGDNKHYPYGWFGSPAHDGFVLPIEDAAQLQRFSSTFKLTRNGEPGLSVVVPYFHRDFLTLNNLRLSILKHYFYPILSGELEVEVVGKDDAKITFSKSSIKELAAQILTPGDQDFKGMLDLAAAFLAADSAQCTVAKSQEAHRSPLWTDTMFSGEQLDKLAEDFDAGSMICVKVPVFIIPKNSEPKPSFFHLILRRDPDLDKSIDIFVRQGITISGLRSLREAGVRALLVASDRPIASFLGDSENPAHTEWQARSRKFQGKYLVGPSTLDFVKDAPRSMMRLLNKRSEMIDETALRHIFPNPSMTGKNAPDKKREVALDPTRTAPPKPTVESKPKSFALSKTREGFTVSLSQFGKSKLPLTLMIRCAYDTGSGNPLKRWSFADFDFAHENMVSMTGGTWLEMSGNTLRVIAESGEFALRATGFDQNRDVIVDVRLEGQQHA